MGLIGYEDEDVSVQCSPTLAVFILTTCRPTRGIDWPMPNGPRVYL